MRMFFLNNSLNCILFIVISMIIFLPRVSFSEDYNVTNFGEKKVTTEQFIKALKPNEDQPTQDSGGGLNFRGLGIGGVKKALTDASKKAASLELKFEFASYQLTDEAKEYLDQLGLALKDKKLAQDHFLVEGHTDSQGTKEYNMMLSRSRALAVKQYLVSKFNIDPNRLDAIGRGESELLDKKNPGNSLNRRVQVVNIR